MRSRCAVYVDAGYLLASAATRVTGTSLRGSVKVDHPMLVDGLIAQAETESALPLLRVNWYDSGSQTGGVPDRTQEQIGMLPRVKLRLGRLSAYGEQKGVDLRLGLDLVTHARNRVVDVMYLVSGDDDLTEAVEEAQGLGIQVILLAVPNTGDQPHAVSQHLQREADGIIVVNPTTIDGAVVPMPREARLTSKGTGGGPAGSRAPTELTVPTPAALAKLRATRPSTFRDRAPEGAARGSLVYTSETGQASSVDNAQEIDETLGDVVDEVRRSVLATWASHATDQDRDALLGGRPFIPGDVDRALLIDLSARLKIYDIQEPTRFLLRGRFWMHAEQILGN